MVTHACVCVCARVCVVCMSVCVRCIMHGLMCHVPYTAKLSRGKTFAVGVEKDRSRENVRGSSIS